jgi:uncharacterized membrane protein YphA (DoxX/SURF4 family)
MTKTTLGARYVLGILLLLVGFNKFFGFMPTFDMAPQAAAFMQALMESGYLLPTIALVEIASGLLFLSSKSTPLANLLLAPISVNIILFHVFLDPASILMALIVAALNIFLIVRYFEVYRPIFDLMKTKGPKSLDSKETLHQTLHPVS